MVRLKLNPTLELRLVQPSDAPALFAVIETHRAKMREWLPWVDATRKLADTQKYIATALRENAASRTFTCGIWSHGQIVGIIGHNRIDWSLRIGFPAYWLAPSSEGQGIMTQCLRAVIDQGFGELQLNRMVLAVATENLRAQKLPERLGFVRINTLKKAEWLYDRHVDHFVYSLPAPKLRAAGQPDSKL